MTIMTSYSEVELQKLIADAVQKGLSNAVPAPRPEISDRIGLDEVAALTGWTKSTLYRKSCKGELPFAERFGKRLVFSREEVLRWMDEKTTRKLSALETATKHLQEEVNNRG